MIGFMSVVVNIRICGIIGKNSILSMAKRENKKVERNL